MSSSREAAAGMPLERFRAGSLSCGVHTSYCLQMQLHRSHPLSSFLVDRLLAPASLTMGKRASSPAANQEKTLWNALLYAPKKESAEEASFRKRKLQEFREASSDTRDSMIQEFLQANKKIKKWQVAVSEKVAESKKAREGAYEDWMDLDTIAFHHHIDARDPQRARKLELLTKDLPERPHRVPALAKEGFKEYYYKLQKTNEVISESERSRTMTLQADAGRVVFNPAIPGEAESADAAPKISPLKAEFEKLAKDATALERAAQAELSRHRELERDCEIVNDDSISNGMVQVKAHMEKILEEFDTQQLLAKRFLQNFKESEVKDQTDSLKSCCLKLEEAIQAYQWKKKVTNRFLINKRKQSESDQAQKTSGEDNKPEVQKPEDKKPEDKKPQAIPETEKTKK